MKAINIEVSNDTKKAIKTYLSLNEKFRNSYFWSSPSSAHARRKFEKDNSFSYKGDKIDLSFEVSCSCKNIYVKKNVQINGSPTNASSLKKYVK